jgi:hypothetical protein
MKKINFPYLIDSIYKVHSETENCQFKDLTDKKIVREMNTLKRYFGADDHGILILLPILVNHFNLESTSFKELSQHFDLTPLKMLEYQESINKLIDCKLIVNSFDSRYTSKSPIESVFKLNNIISKAITNKTAIKLETKKSNATNIELLDSIYELGNYAVNCNMLGFEFIKRYEDIINNSSSIELVSKINELKLPKKDEILYYLTIWKSITSNDGFSIEDASQLIAGHVNRINFKQEVFNGSHILLVSDLVQLQEVGMMDELSFFLTEKSIVNMSKIGIHIKSKNAKKQDRILPKMIAEKQLFYNEPEQVQIHSLESILQDENYNQLRERLASKNLPIGLNILLYGAPGTGKTETVYQLARQSGREIIKVEISQTKSKWFGESEKNIKQIFNNYSSCAKNSAQMPILLFNEADAVLTSRNSNMQGNTKQIENAIQNILLEELEKFEGILFATTNLEQNLDKAFDRRFLYKVEFSIPGMLQRKAIIEKRIPFLASDDYMELASSFDFSGGQIENIARKCEIHFIMNGQSPDLNQVILFCNEELSIAPKSLKRPIGFGNQ